MVKKVNIYIDGANFYHGLKTVNFRYSDIFFDFKKFVENIVREDELVKVYYYNAPLKENLNKYVYWNQMKLFNRLKKIPKFDVVLCKRQKRLDNNNDEYYVIKGDDIHLSLDMLRDACKDKYDKVILISGDGDFAPLIKYVKEEGKEVVGYYFKNSVSRDLLKEFPKKNRFVINRKTVNKFFWRDKK